MTLAKSVLIGAALLAGASTLAGAQVPYQPRPYTPVPATPPSWSYDPYTSGLSPCTQYTPGDLGKCGDRMPATFGQPSFGQHTYPPQYLPGYYPPPYRPPGYPPPVR
jgi:hypothetical protein